MTIIPDQKPPADKTLGAVAELNARIVAAGAVAADFHTAMAGFQGGGQQPDYATWALRLDQHLDYVLEALNVQDDDDDGEFDGLEPCCAACGAWIGIFRGHGDGWHHYRGEGTAASPVELYDAGHAPEVAWCRPPGRSISPADAAVLGQALADAETYRRDGAGDWCADCAASPAEACDDHLDDLDRADAYAEVGHRLQQEEAR